MTKQNRKHVYFYRGQILNFDSNLNCTCYLLFTDLLYRQTVTVGHSAIDVEIMDVSTSVVRYQIFNSMFEIL